MRILISYIHGWSLSGNPYDLPSVQRLVDATLAQQGINPAAIQISSQSVHMKDTRNYTFIQCAHQLMQTGWMQNGAGFDRHYAVCHSMGGLVARTMMVLGYRFDGVLTLNTPHHGTAGWTTGGSIVGSVFVGPGAQSMMNISQDLRWLNETDGPLRDRLYCLGVRCHGIGPVSLGPPIPWTHDNDTLIEYASQTAAGLGDAVRRYGTLVDYGVNFVPQACAATPGHPHNFVIDFAAEQGSGPFKFDNTPLRQAIVDCIRLH
ncbi:hypothetical protein [Novosphingobium sp. B 225]|uniref:hypothetical protein n=1 Tax=Novosphingobium sp. B 225 TaxID=1961849 RepID=UPI000B4A6C9B|nr:hypothetical protein [Novosphingobium sp. B 225]